MQRSVDEAPVAAPAESRDTPAALQRSPDTAPPAPRVRAEREVPSAEDAASTRQFQDDFLRSSSGRGHGILGPNGGFESTAVFATETQRLSEQVRSHDVFDEVSRKVEMAPTESYFVDNLPSLMSFSDPMAIVEGRHADATLGQRVSRKEELPSPISEIWELTKAGRLHTGGQDHNRPRTPEPVRRAPAAPPQSAPEALYRVAPPGDRTLRRFGDSVHHEGATAPLTPTPQIVARSVDAATPEPATPSATSVATAPPTAATITGHETFRARPSRPSEPGQIARSVDT
ncbi:MAG TPA: hypothetical protein VN697_07770, partial [Tepidiformaceae bacterium]|nr:hypothetical protein [Tepidiformaceae bacterium]